MILVQVVENVCQLNSHVRAPCGWPYSCCALPQIEKIRDFTYVGARLSSRLFEKLPGESHHIVEAKPITTADQIAQRSEASFAR